MLAVRNNPAHYLTFIKSPNILPQPHASRRIRVRVGVATETNTNDVDVHFASPQLFPYSGALSFPHSKGQCKVSE